MPPACFRTKMVTTQPFQWLPQHRATGGRPGWGSAPGSRRVRALWPVSCWNTATGELDARPHGPPPYTRPASLLCAAVWLRWAWETRAPFWSEASVLRSQATALGEQRAPTFPFGSEGAGSVRKWHAWAHRASQCQTPGETLRHLPTAVWVCAVLSPPSQVVSFPASNAACPAAGDLVAPGPCPSPCLRHPWLVTTCLHGFPLMSFSCQTGRGL